ncbi:MAG: sulfurtransferase [Lysobacterales bacterium]|jgi:thiosulfate/3-mercaptopyruvate sulfurtransferase
MPENFLITAPELKARLDAGDYVVFDCRFSLVNPAAGLEAYLDGHIPSAVHVNLDDDLAGPVTAASGRHPLPGPDKFAEFLARSGWAPGKTLVAYDDVGGAIAARLWWLMRYFGQQDARLLDGGIAAWKAAELALEQGQSQPRRQPSVKLEPSANMVLSTDEVAAGLQKQDIVLIDARSEERFAGKGEPIDAVAGHVPGAVNYPFNRSLEGDGTFKPASAIRAGITPLVGSTPARQVVHMCGSGVTACHNLLAAEMAGFSGCKLYVGSWSEWIRDGSRPVL